MWSKAFSEDVAMSTEQNRPMLPKTWFVMSIVITPHYLVYTSSFKAFSTWGCGSRHCSRPQSIPHWHPHAPLYHLVRKESSLTLTNGNGTRHLRCAHLALSGVCSSHGNPQASWQNIWSSGGWACEVGRCRLCLNHTQVIMAFVTPNLDPSQAL